MLWLLGRLERVGGVDFFMTVTTTTDLTSYATRTPGTGVGGSMSSLSCVVNVAGARNLSVCVDRRLNISATCVTSFVENIGRNADGADPGSITCVTNLRVNRRINKHVFSVVDRHVFKGSSARDLDGRGFLTNFVTTLRGGNVGIAVRRTGTCIRSGTRTVGAGTARTRFTRGGTTNRGFLTRGTGGRNIGAASDKLRCGVVGRNGNTIPASSSGMGMGCGNALVSKARFSDSCSHGRPAAFHTGRMVGK